MGRMTSVLPTSYSALSSFETCPRRHYLTRISKEVADPPGEAAQWGNTVHAALQRYIQGDASALSGSLKGYRHLADTLVTRIPGAEIHAELQLAVDHELNPCGWWDKRGWIRGIVDALVLNGNVAYAVDWKTGKRKDDEGQLALFAGLVMTHYPEVEKVQAGYVWLQEKLIDRSTFRRDDLPLIWQQYAPRVEQLRRAFANDNWPARPSGLCRNWCPVGRRLCEHCGS